MKYIVCRVKRNGKTVMDVPVVFPDFLVHAMVFAQMRALLETQYFKASAKTEVVALSAGELSSTGFAVSATDGLCHGRSDTLGVKSRGELNDRLIHMADYGACAMDAD